MSREQFLNLQERLLNTRRDLLNMVKDIQSRMQQMSEPLAEIEEEAQKNAITLPYDRLDGQGKATIEQIDLALNKLAVGEYGFCENCGEEISIRRLEAVPWTRLCIDCARQFERSNQVLPTAAEVIESGELPDEFQGLSNNQILAIINEHVKRDERIDTEELNFSLHNGILYLEGTIAGEPEHQILLQILTDILGFSSIVDHLALNVIPFEREDRTPGRRPRAAGAVEDRLFYDEDDLDEDLFEAGDEKPYSPPEEPLPHEYYEEHKPGEEHTI